jgi:hypothetical protein
MSKAKTKYRCAYTGEEPCTTHGGYCPLCVALLNGEGLAIINRKAWQPGELLEINTPKVKGLWDDD